MRRKLRATHTMAGLSTAVSRWTGSSPAFLSALVLVALWAAAGPMFHYSTTWQLFINTGTTIVTFLMVFLIQRAQNKDALAIQMKLNELVAAGSGASNRLIGVEDLTEDELQALHKHYAQLIALAAHDHSIRASHSIEEAQRRHKRKQHRSRPVGRPGPAA